MAQSCTGVLKYLLLDDIFKRTWTIWTVDMFKQQEQFIAISGLFPIIQGHGIIEEIRKQFF